MSHEFPDMLEVPKKSLVGHPEQVQLSRSRFSKIGKKKMLEKRVDAPTGALERASGVSAWEPGGSLSPLSSFPQINLYVCYIYLLHTPQAAKGGQRREGKGG